MRYLFFLSFLVVNTCMTVSAFAEEGLLVHFIFDNMNGKVVKDLSGSGHPGTLFGEARCVETEKGKALEIFGPSGSLNLGNSLPLKINGDMTIEAWVKGTNPSSDDQIILADTAGFAINRNYCLYNSKGTLRFEHGDGKINAGYATDGVVFDSQWHHMAFVAEYPAYYMYIDGVCVKRGRMSFNIVHVPQSEAIACGGWFAGRFCGLIKELRLYRKAVSSLDLAKHAGVSSPSTPLIDISFKPMRVENKVRVEVFGDRLQGRFSQMRVTLKPSGPQSEQTQVVDILETRPGTNRIIGNAVFALTKIEAGEYSIHAALIDKGGKNLAEKTHLVKYAGTPDWVTSRAGISDKVLPPWTPVKVDPIDQGVEVGVWGRVYRFEQSLFPTRITTKTSQILASPITITAKVLGKTVAFDKATITVVKQEPGFVVLTALARAWGMTLTVTHRIEYDGFIRSDWSIQSADKKKLEQLAFDIPIKSGNAIYFYNSMGWDPSREPTKPGEFKNGTIFRVYNPYLWIGDNERGVQWACESRRNWFNADEGKAITLIKDAKIALMRLNLVDTPVVIGGNKKLDYSFGMVASPVKPIEKDCWDWRIVNCLLVLYGKDYDLLTASVDGQPILDYYRQIGIKTVLITNWTTIMAYTHPLGWADKLHALVRECHKRGIKVIPYFGYQISEKAPEWPEFGEEVTTLPGIRNPDRYPGFEVQMVDVVCLRSVWKNFLAETIGKLIDEFDVDGIYLDSTVMPVQCRNSAHGCGFLDAKGNMQMTYSVFDTRETLKRLYNVVKSRKPDGIVDCHPFDAMNLPALSWATSYWNGEQLGGTPTKEGVKRPVLERLPLDRFRSEFMGVQWGIPAETLSYMLGSFRATQAISFLHNVPVRLINTDRKDLDRTVAVWKLRDEFGVKESSWLPYWNNSDYVNIGPQGVYCSLYRHPRNGMLAIVSNLTPTSTTAALTMNWEKLGLDSNGATALDGVTRQPEIIRKNKIEFSLSSMDWKYIWIKSLNTK